MIQSEVVHVDLDKFKNADSPIFILNINGRCSTCTALNTMLEVRANDWLAALPTSKTGTASPCNQIGFVFYFQFFVRTTQS